MGEWRPMPRRIDDIDDILGQPQRGVRIINIALHFTWFCKFRGKVPSEYKVKTHRPQTLRARLWRMIFGG